MKSRPCGNPKRELSRADAHSRKGCFWGVNGVPLGPDPNPRLGQGRGPPGQSRGYSLGNSKKGKKNKHIFFGTCFKLGFIVQVSNPNVLQAGTCARP